MDRFGKLHPVVILFYYMAAMGLLIFVPHPAIAFVMGVASLLYYVTFAGLKKGLCRLLWGGMLSLSCLVINPLLNHRGVTLLFCIGDMRITWEAFCYGAYMALIFSASLQIFSCLSHTMTAEKIMTLTARRFPAFSLLFSMILRLVPKAARDFREMTSLNGNRPAVWSALIGMELEDSMKRGISMKARGYGRGKRSSFYQRRMQRLDVILFFVIFLLAAAVFTGWYKMGGNLRFFPSLRVSGMPLFMWILLLIFGFLPIGMRGKEEIAWYVSRRKITGSAIQNRQSMR